MTNIITPTPGDLRVGVFVAPTLLITAPARDVVEAENLREFSTASSTLSREHGNGGTFPSDAFIQRFNGSTWEIAPTVNESTPWRVVTVDGVFRFATEEMAHRFAAPGEVVEHAPGLELARMG
jgi:hypothetical protein